MKLSLINNKNFMLVLYFTSFFLLTDFALYYFPLWKNLYWLFLSLLFIISVLHSRRIDKIVVIYFLLFIIGVSISFLFGESVNGVLLVPIFSYMCFHIQKQSRYRIDLSLFSNIIVTFLICFSVTELLVKLNMIQFPWMHIYLTDSGAKRIDVLRLRGPFGSPLSLSAIAVYLFFYSIYMHKNLFCFYGSIVIILLSGSRTAFVICIILFLFISISSKMTIKKTRYIFLAILMGGGGGYYFLLCDKIWL
jgi:hypothetical protein